MLGTSTGVGVSLCGFGVCWWGGRVVFGLGFFKSEQ